MLGLPYNIIKCNCRKSIIAIFLILLSLVSYYRLNFILIEMAAQDARTALQIIEILVTISVVSIGLNVFFIKHIYFLCNQVKIHRSLEEKLCHQRDFDILSGLRNRNSFAYFAQQIEKRGDMVSVMVCDIDGLKIINDTLGHITGDKIIQEAAKILREACPSNSHIFRIGGDEFFVLIQETLLEKELIKVRSSIKNRIASYNADQPSIPLSMSIGFATSINHNTFWEVSKEADHNMYQEKRACQEKVYNNLRMALIE